MQDNSQAPQAGTATLPFYNALLMGRQVENQGESGLAQLSRLAQANYTTASTCTVRKQPRHTYQKQHR